MGVRICDRFGPGVGAAGDAGAGNATDHVREPSLLAMTAGLSTSMRPDLARKRGLRRCGLPWAEKREEHAGRELIWQIAARRGIYKKVRKTQCFVQDDPRNREGKGILLLSIFVRASGAATSGRLFQSRINREVFSLHLLLLTVGKVCFWF
jgi:hypothetical protein